MGNERKFYRKHMRLKTVLRTIALVILTVTVLLVAVFLWFRRYIVYTEDGLYLDIPWLNEERIQDDSPSAPDETELIDTEQPDGESSEPVSDSQPS